MMEEKDDRPILRGMGRDEMAALLASAGFPEFRGRQLFHWVQKKAARSFDEMRNLPADLRAWLLENTRLGGVKSVAVTRRSADGSFKFLFELEDGRKVESVLMYDPKRNYWTQCLSSQVGCAVDCRFCVTGYNGFFRQMRTDEIVDQVLFARRHLLAEIPDANFRNIVYMGMGEPLLNTGAVIPSIRLLVDQEGQDFSPKRITVSTSGILPGMIELSESGVGACLAVSLNASNQQAREEVMPITGKYPLDELLRVCRDYPFSRHKRITFEYVLLAGVNDAPEHADELVVLLRPIPCKVNVIPFNPSPLLPYGRPSNEAVEAFVARLARANFTVSVRWSKALDVDGACGQLAGQHRQRRPAAVAASSPADGDLGFFAPAPSDGDEDG